MDWRKRRKIRKINKNKIMHVTPDVEPDDAEFGEFISSSKKVENLENALIRWGNSFYIEAGPTLTAVTGGGNFDDEYGKMLDAARALRRGILKEEALEAGGGSGENLRKGGSEVVQQLGERATEQARNQGDQSEGS